MSLTGIFAASLAMDNPVFPGELANNAAVVRYMQDRFGVGMLEELKGDWLEAYMPTLKTTVGKGWAKHSIRYLKGLATFSGSLERVTDNKAQEYLNSLVAAGRSNATHNKALAACSKFYKWAKKTQRIRHNPFEDIKQIREELVIDIVYCTPEERGQIIQLAKSTGCTEWLAIAIAFYEGMRRGEIARLDWPNVRFDSGTIVVPKSKTGKGRTIPLHSELEKMLLEVPKSERIGYVVKTEHDTGNYNVDETARLDRFTNFITTIRGLREAQLLQEQGIPRPDLFAENAPRTRTGAEWKKQKAEYQSAVKAWQKERNKRTKEINMILERIGWNPFRHTFGSLLAQAGVSIDKISAWMGNTPEVCRRHYAQFIPRDRRDSEIDKL
jgi:integrase